LTTGPDSDREPDIVLEILERVRRVVPALTEDQVREVEQAVRADYGGMRFRVAKRKKHPSPEQRRRIFQLALTDTSTEQLTQDTGISRRTMYRYLKRGGE
jgi:hypothetical protein